MISVRCAPVGAFSLRLSQHVLRLIGMASLLTLATPTQAGFLEVLFGQPGPGSASFFGSQQPMPPSPEEELERQRQNRLAIESQMSEQAARNLKSFRVLSDIAHENGRKQAFLMDPTLRYGDIVVTDTGLEVYEGKSWKERSPLLFRPLHLSALRNRKDLQLLQKASGFPAAPEPVQTASNIRTITISGQQKSKTEQQRTTVPQTTASIGQTETRPKAATHSRTANTNQEAKPRLEIVRPTQSGNNVQIADTLQTSAPAQKRKPSQQTNKIKPQAESPVAANVFFLFR